MKKINIKSIILGFLVLVSCEGYLDEKDYSNLTTDSFIPTVQGMEALVNGCYTPMRFWYGKEWSINFTEMGTDIFLAGNHYIAHPFATFSDQLDGEAQYLEECWRYFYLGLNNANAAIGRIDESELSDDMKKIRMGEVLFLRAFYLWHIVGIWGNVHFSIEETTSAPSVGNKTDESVFYKQILEDLETAVTTLPVSTSEYGRVTKPAAEAFLARAYLDYASMYSETPTADFEKAKNYASKLINDYSFSLTENYSDLFHYKTVGQDKNEEIIWSVIWPENDLYGATILEGQQDKVSLSGVISDWKVRGPGNNLHLFWVMVYQEIGINGTAPVQRTVEDGRAFNRYIPSVHLLDLYDETMDSRFDVCFQGVWYCNNPLQLANGDSMLVGDTAILVSKYSLDDDWKASKPYVIFDRDDLYDSDGLGIGTRDENYSFKKFFDDTRGMDNPDEVNVNDESSSMDFYIFRLAEMYFIRAEANLNLGDKPAAAADLNIIRERAAFEGMESAIDISADDVDIDFILDEKAREFAGEAIRWFDLKRTGKLVERIKKYNLDCAPHIQDFHTKRPIPQSELDAVLNKDVFTQHEGYLQ